MMEMSKEAEREHIEAEKGVVKTEVPTKVYWAKRKYEIKLDLSFFFNELPFFTDQHLFYLQSLKVNH